MASTWASETYRSDGADWVAAGHRSRVSTVGEPLRNHAETVLGQLGLQVAMRSSFPASSRSLHAQRCFVPKPTPVARDGSAEPSETSGGLGFPSAREATSIFVFCARPTLKHIAFKASFSGGFPFVYGRLFLCFGGLAR